MVCSNRFYNYLSRYVFSIYKIISLDKPAPSMVFIFETYGKSKNSSFCLDGRVLGDIRHWVTYLRSSHEWHAIVCHPPGLLRSITSKHNPHRLSFCCSAASPKSATPPEMRFVHIVHTSNKSVPLSMCIKYDAGHVLISRLSRINKYDDQGS